MPTNFPSPIFAWMNSSLLLAMLSDHFIYFCNSTLCCCTGNWAGAPVNANTGKWAGSYLKYIVQTLINTHNVETLTNTHTVETLTNTHNVETLTNTHKHSHCGNTCRVAINMSFLFLYTCSDTNILTKIISFNHPCVCHIELSSTLALLALL